MQSAAGWSGWEMVEPRAPLRHAERSVDSLPPGHALVRVAGCGICHTDLGFLDDGVRTRQPLPLILGHEISGVVQAAADDVASWVGRPVVVPAVLPCGDCPECQAGRPMICKRQIMPGNDSDGGFASHVVVPARWLCEVPGATTDFDAVIPGGGGLTLRHLAVVADAVTTPYQAIVRAGLQSGDVAVVIGLGGVGGYAAQIACAMGAQVAAIEVDPAKLARAEDYGVGLAIDATDAEPRAMRKRIQQWARSNGAPTTRWTLLECSGSAAGQRTAWGLMVHGAKLAVVGYTMDKIEVRLSNLMAFDAQAIGNWGCDPALYPDVVDLALSGRIDLRSHTELRPLTAVEQALDDVRHHRVASRLVLTP